MSVDLVWLRSHIRDIPDFPEPGVVFKDITPLLADVDAFRFAIDALADHFAGENIDLIAGIEARGFLLAAPLAYRFGSGIVPIRKQGKLPAEVVGEDYELEYGTDRLEVHSDLVSRGDRVLIVDDVLATGGTAACAARLLTSIGAEVVGFGFLIDLVFLGGAGKLEQYEVMSLLHYE
jgi:adenine phosphoribosyltransferase